MSGALSILGSGTEGISGLSVVLNRAALFGFKPGIPGTAQTASSVTVTISGGTPPYTGVWTKVSGDVEIGNTSSTPTTKFAAYFTANGTYEAVWKYVVTDSLAATADSNFVNVTLSGGDTV